MDTTNNPQIHESPADNGKSEDPAKMTYSIPDFVSRNHINMSTYCQHLPCMWPTININICPEPKPLFRRTLTGSLHRLTAPVG